MKRPILITALSALTLAPVAVVLAAAGSSGGPAPCPNLYPHEPIVVYEVSGYSLGGFIDQALVVYRDGSARLSHATLDGNGSRSQWTYVGQDAAIELARNLANLGAREVCDRPEIVADLPLTTLTIIGPQTDARAHTASWWFPDTPQLQSIQLRINGFIATFFPNNPPGG
jgi:hypothetical protein